MIQSTRIERSGQTIMYLSLSRSAMYPSLLIEYQWGPRHLGKLFCDLFAGLKAERLEAKHTGQKVKNMFLKIVLNSPTGKMQQEVSWMYDPFNVFKIRINGQLILLLLLTESSTGLKRALNRRFQMLLRRQKPLLDWNLNLMSMKHSINTLSMTTLVS